MLRRPKDPDASAFHSSRTNGSSQGVDGTFADWVDERGLACIAPGRLWTHSGAVPAMPQNLLTTVSLQSSETLSQLTQGPAARAATGTPSIHHRHDPAPGSLRLRFALVPSSSRCVSRRCRSVDVSPPKRLTVTVPECWRRGPAAPAGDRPQTIVATQPVAPSLRSLHENAAQTMRSDGCRRRRHPCVTTPFRFGSPPHRNMTGTPAG